MHPSVLISLPIETPKHLPRITSHLTDDEKENLLNEQPKSKSQPKITAKCLNQTPQKFAEIWRTAK